MQEKQNERKGKEIEPAASPSQEEPEENRPVEEMEEPAAEEQAATDEEEPVEKDEGEGEPVEEAEEEEIAEGEFIQRRGCLRGCLTPIAAIFVIVLVMAMLVYAKRSAISEWLRGRIIANTQNRVLSDLPDDLDEKEIEATFEKVKTALKEGRIDEEALDEAIREYHDTIRKRPPPEQKKQEIDRLMAGLNAAIIVSEE